MLHANDKQNQSKHRKMSRRLLRGILKPWETNHGLHGESKVHPFCKWARRKEIKVED